MGRAGQSQAPLSYAAQGRHASRVASARTLGRTLSRVCKPSKAQPRLSSQELVGSSVAPRRGERKVGCSIASLHVTERRQIPWVRSAPSPVARLRPSRSRSFSRPSAPEVTPRPTHLPRMSVRQRGRGPGCRLRPASQARGHENTSLWAGRRRWLCHLLRQRLRPTVRPNPSLERRPREAGRPGAAQGSRELHCPARRQVTPPHGSPQLER